MVPNYHSPCTSHSELVITNPFITNFPIKRTNLEKTNQFPSKISFYREDSLSRDNEFVFAKFDWDSSLFRGSSLSCLPYREWNCQGQKISVSELSIFYGCMMSLHYCVITFVHISTRVVSF